MEMKSVHVGSDEFSKLEDVMQLLARMPYNALLNFAAVIEGDADKIADAYEAFMLADAEATAK